MFAPLSKLFSTSTSNKPRKLQSYRPRMEGLEDRMLMAGNITAGIDVGGNLQLHELSGQAGRDNGVQINRLSNGMIHVEGIATSDGTKSLINGAPSQDFKITGALLIDLGAGSDRVTIGNLGPISFAALSISLGLNSDSDGHSDVVLISNLTTTATGSASSIHTGAGGDFVSITDSKLAGSLTMSMGRGNDSLDLKRTEIGNGVGVSMDPTRAKNSGDFGADAVIVENLVTKFGISVTTDPQFLSDGSPAQVGNADFISMAHVRAGSVISLNTFGGADDIELVDVHAKDKIFASLGAGNDVLNLLHVSADDIDVGGGSGFDRLKKNDVVFGTHMRIVGFEEIEIPQLTTSTSPNGTLSPK